MPYILQYHCFKMCYDHRKEKSQSCGDYHKVGKGSTLSLQNNPPKILLLFSNSVETITLPQMVENVRKTPIETLYKWNIKIIVVATFALFS